MWYIIECYYKHDICELVPEMRNVENVCNIAILCQEVLKIKDMTSG